MTARNLNHSLLLGSSLLLGLGLSACSKPGANFDALATGQSFQQNAVTVNNKIDILWVVDNSASMDPLQQNMVSNFNNFIQNFQTKGFDYNMVVTTSDSYLAAPTYDNNPTLAAWRDGVGSALSGFFYITPLIPNIVQNFVTNATQGALGSADERAFSSITAALSSPLNAGFPRAGSFFAVIILSDEDDFTDPNRPELSWIKGGLPDHDYADTNLVTVNSMVSYLDNLTSSTPTNRHYNVSAISVLDSACQASHVAASPATIVGQRYMQLVTDTNGILGSICDSSYANSLNFIQQQIISLSSEFALSGSPNASTIVVTVNGQTVPQSTTNGWTYIPASNTIQFTGSAVPSASASISVAFQPSQLQ